MAHRLGPRLRFLLWAPGFVAVLVAFALLATVLPNLLRTSVGDALDSTNELLAPLVAERESLDAVALQSWVEELARSRRLRLTVIADDGRVLAESTRDYAGMLAMDNHGSRPEVLAARADGTEGRATRRSDTTGRSYVYVARLQATPSGGLWIVRLARPLGELATLNRQILLTLLLTAAVAAGGVAAVLIWFRRSFLAPFSELLAEAEHLATGDPSYRVSDPPVEELAVLSRTLNRLADRVEEQFQEKERERRQLQEILAGVPIGVLVTRSDRTPIYVNSTFHTTFGVRFMDEARIAAFLAEPPIAELLDEASRWEDVVEASHTWADRDLAVTARRIEGLDGILLMVRDVTDANRMTRMRRDFVANLSHEIKTPLAVIRGAAETIEEAAEDPDAIQRFVAIIVKQIYRLEDLLKDLLTLSRLERPEAALETRTVDLAEVCERALELIQPVAERERVALESSIAAVPPFEGDPKALERMVINLLINAIQYNRPQGGVRIRLEPTQDGVSLEVEDDGYGIPEDELPRIFERFYRVDKGRGRREGGSGLGLAIVKHVTQFHGGTVEVRSYVDRGTTFRILLPIATVRAREQPEIAVGARELRHP